MRGLAAVLGAGLVLGGCAAIPDSGPVESATQVDDPVAGASRYAPARPREGATPEQVVRGYLDAMLAYPVSSAVAAQFLTPAARRSWRPSDGTTVYEQPSFSFIQQHGPAAVESEAGSEVELRARRRADLDAAGRFDATDRALAQRFRLQRVDGEWRIVNPPAGTLVTQEFFANYFRPYAVWFFDRPGRRLVPEIVHLVAGERLATSLATSLAAGPADPRTRRTYLDADDDLRPSVPVDRNGIADVDVAGRVATRPVSEQEHLTAQLVRTLRQAPDVRSVRITAGSVLVTPDDGGETDVPSRFDPPDPALGVYAVVRDRLRVVSGAGTRAAPGSWGRSARGVGEVAVGPDGVAAVADGGDAVRVTDLQGSGGRTLAARDVVTVTWDRFGVLWIVDRPAGRVRVRTLRGPALETVPTVGLVGLDLTSFAVSADGGHYAVTDGRAGVRVGNVRRTGTLDAVSALHRPRRIVTTADRPHAVRWLDDTHVDYLAGTTAGVQVHSIAIDGSDRGGGLGGGEALLPDVGARRLALEGGTGSSLWITDDRGRLWYRPEGQSWLIADEGPVTSLSSTS